MFGGPQLQVIQGEEPWANFQKEEDSTGVLFQVLSPGALHLHGQMDKSEAEGQPTAVDKSPGAEGMVWNTHIDGPCQNQQLQGLLVVASRAEEHTNLHYDEEKQI